MFDVVATQTLHETYVPYCFFGDITVFLKHMLELLNVLW